MIEKNFKCDNGRTVTIRIDDENEYLATVFDQQFSKLGQLEFSEIDGYLKLVWAYLDQSDPLWCRQGIGREILRQVSDYSGYTIVANDHDGMNQDDGSHLTGDAPAFVAKMKEERLIQSNSDDLLD